MSERKNIKRNNARVSKEVFLTTGRKGNTRIHLYYEDSNYLNRLVAMGLM